MIDGDGAAAGAWSLLTPAPARPSSSISALVFLVLGEVTPSWSSLTRGSSEGGLRRAGSPAAEPDLGLDLALEDSGSGSGLGLGRGAIAAEEEEEEDDEGLGVDEDEEEPGLLSLETEEGREGLELPRWSGGGGLLFGAEEDEDDEGTADLASCFAGSRSRPYEPRLGSLYRSTVRTFP